MKRLRCLQEAGDRHWLILVAFVELLIATISTLIVLDFIAQSKDAKPPGNGLVPEREFYERIKSQSIQMRFVVVAEGLYGAVAVLTVAAAALVRRLPRLLDVVKWMQIAVTVVAWLSAIVGLAYIIVLLFGGLSSQRSGQISRFLGVRINSDGLKLIVISYCCLVGMVAVIAVRFILGLLTDLEESKYYSEHFHPVEHCHTEHVTVDPDDQGGPHECVEV